MHAASLHCEFVPQTSYLGTITLFHDLPVPTLSMCEHLPSGVELVHESFFITHQVGLATSPAEEPTEVHELLVLRHSQLQVTK